MTRGTNGREAWRCLLRRAGAAALLCFLWRTSHGQETRVIITEILSAGSSVLLDADGESPDWIELHNPGPADVDLDGWFLTDDAATLNKWRFPATTLAAGDYLVIFASGKDRAVAGEELHTSFKLDADGEYLALVRPDGVTVADGFAPSLPAQRDGIAFGDGIELLAPPLVPHGAPARALVPADGTLGTRWTGAAADEPFDDSAAAGWIAGATGAGFDLGSAEAGPIFYFDFDDASVPARASDRSGNGSDGTITSHQALAGSGGGAVPRYTADGGGHSAQPGDRALDFGLTGDGGVVDVPAAAAGIFDAARQRDQIAISLWILGSASQPDDDVLFWGSSDAGGTGIRSLNAHAPWSDGTIYWDTSGCCDGTQRVSRAEPDSTRWRGRWNHYVFQKEGSRKTIWQNGALFHEGSNTAPLTAVRGFFIGCAVRSGEWSYGGKIDDFAVWDRALTPAQIQALAVGASPLRLSSFAHLIGLDLAAAMLDRSASAYLRVPFAVDPEATFDALLLRVRFDAGFVAYLNGVEVARRSAPLDLSHDAAATSGRSDAATLARQVFDITSRRELLRPGQNVLAIHALNESAADRDLLVAPELIGARVRPGQYLSPPTPGALNGAGRDGFVDDVRFSVEHGLFDAPFELALSCPTPGTTIHYALGGVAPGPGLPGSRLYVTPIAIARTTVVRAVAIKPEHEPSRIAARTYVFPADVLEQPARPAGLPAEWAGATADYQVDPDVVQTALPGYEVDRALRAIPSVSIVMDPRDLFSSEGGIYYHSQQRWERAAAVEMFYQGGGGGFATGAGVRIHGYTSRDPGFTLKHSFRVTFKSAFGPSRLEAPIFPDSDVRSFDQLVLRGMSTDSWPVMDGWASPIPGVPRWWRERATYLREQWMKDAQIAMGQLAPHAVFVHLYLNGLYWGLYHLTERPTESFLADHLGGEKEEYDVLKDFAELHGGDKQAWDAMMSLASQGLGSAAAYQRILGNNPDGTRNLAFPVYVDLDNLIDYMIVHILAGADDWPNHNWWSGRRRGDESTGFKFFAWDQEISNISLVQTMSSWGIVFEQAGVYDTPSYVYAQMRANPAFRLRFADRVQKHLFGKGALTPASCDARWTRRAAEIDQAIVGESARWGDTRRAVPYKREVEWLTELAWMATTYWREVHPIALERFRRVGLYPALAAPVLSHDGGRFTGELAVALSAAAGTIHCTLDGSDPRTASGTVAPSAFTPGGPVPIAATTTLRARARNGAVWSALVEAYYFRDLPLRITELMYHPRATADPGYGADDFEFIELENVGDAPVSLRGVKLEGAARFDFDAGAIASLGPGERVVLPRNLSAFATRYRLLGMLIPGVFAGELRDSSERILLTGPAGEPIHDFRYSDRWYRATDGEGYSLVAVDPRGDPELWLRREGWAAGVSLDGTPGRGETGETGGRQRPGDFNQDAALDIADAVSLLLHLFVGSGTSLPCQGALATGGNGVLLDANGDGAVDLSDAVSLLNYLFNGGPPPPAGAACVPIEGCPERCR